MRQSLDATCWTGDSIRPRQQRESHVPRSLRRILVAVAVAAVAAAVAAAAGAITVTASRVRESSAVGAAEVATFESSVCRVRRTLRAVPSLQFGGRHLSRGGEFGGVTGANRARVGPVFGYCTTGDWSHCGGLGRTRSARYACPAVSSSQLALPSCSVASAPVGNFV